jgi:hypothetical protein
MDDSYRAEQPSNPVLPLERWRQVLTSVEALCPKCLMNVSGLVCEKKIYPYYMK